MYSTVHSTVYWNNIRSNSPMRKEKVPHREAERDLQQNAASFENLRNEVRKVCPVIMKIELC